MEAPRRAGMDIAEGRQAEEKLRESEERFRTLSDCSPVGIFVTDVAGRCTYTNPRCRVLCGYTAHEALGEGWSRFLHADDRARVLARWSRAAAEAREFLDEHRFVRPDGSLCWVHVRAAPMFSADGAFLGHVGTIEDVSERQRAAAQRAWLLGQIIGAQEEERARVARELHDELGQSLASLRLGLGMLQSAPTLDAAKAHARDLQRLASSILDEARRIARGLRPSALDDLGLPAALERYVAEYAGARGIAVDLETRGCERRLPAPVETALYRIVQEALTNVSRHAEAGRVTITVERTAARVVLTLTDDGCGFDAEAVLSRAGAAAHFGLTSVRERATLVGGSTTIRSSPGAGTTILVEIPLA